MAVADIQLTDECRLLADVAAPPNMQRAFENSLSMALMDMSLGSIESTMGLQMLARDQRTGQAQSVTLTGWTAILGVAALVVLVAVSARFGYQKYYGILPSDSSTVVLKSATRYVRVSTGGD